MKIDDRIIRRLAYDGNYHRAIEMMMDIIVAQNKIIETQASLIEQYGKRLMSLEKSNKLTQEVVVPALIEDMEETSLNSMLEKSYNAQR